MPRAGPGSPRQPTWLNWRAGKSFPPTLKGKLWEYQFLCPSRSGRLVDSDRTGGFVSGRRGNGSPTGANGRGLTAGRVLPGGPPRSSLGRVPAAKACIAIQTNGPNAADHRQGWLGQRSGPRACSRIPKAIYGRALGPAASTGCGPPSSELMGGKRASPQTLSLPSVKAPTVSYGWAPTAKESIGSRTMSFSISARSRVWTAATSGHC